jgi:iron complex transport system ATP-binding protein
MITTRQLRVETRSGAQTRTLVERLDWTVNPGECWAVLGPNGTGKTRLLHTLAGLLPAAGGDVLLAGRAVSAWPRRSLARQRALLFQEESASYWGTVAEYVALGALPHGRAAASDPAVLAALKLTGLEPLAERALMALSGGERQRTRIAQSLAQRPACLLWDEPLNHLDLRHQATTLALARQLADEGRGVVLTLQDPDQARQICTHVLLLYDSGRCRQGCTVDLLDSATVRELYALDLPAPPNPLPLALRAFIPDSMADPH